MEKKESNKNKVNVYSVTIEEGRKNNIADLMPKQNHKNKIPNGYIFYSYKRFDSEHKLDFLQKKFNEEPNSSSVLIVDEKQALSSDKQLIKPEKKELKFSQAYNLDQKKDLEKNKIQVQAEKNFFINLMFFLNLTLFALVAYNQFTALKENQNLIQEFTSSIQSFEQEIQSSTNSILQELKKSPKPTFEQEESFLP